MFRDDLKAALTRAEQLQSDLERAEGRAESSEDEVKSLREQLATQQRDLERLRKEVDEQEQAQRPLVPLTQQKKRRSALLVAMIAIAMLVAGGAASFWITRASPVQHDAPLPTPIPRVAKTPEPPPPPAEGNGERLNRSQIVAGMRAIKGRVQACFDKFREPGRAMVRVKIEANGLVSRARVSGPFASTPTGECISAALKSARFPASKHITTITYPFALR